MLRRKPDHIDHWCRTSRTRNGGDHAGSSGGGCLLKRRQLLDRCLLKGYAQISYHPGRLKDPSIRLEGSGRIGVPNAAGPADVRVKE